MMFLVTGSWVSGGQSDEDAEEEALGKREEV